MAADDKDDKPIKTLTAEDIRLLKTVRSPGRQGLWAPGRAILFVHVALNSCKTAGVAASAALGM
jgi:hypothetical protein